jgi:Spy/CpxP family protein refolding chaperone
MSGNSVTPALTALNTALADEKSTPEEIQQRVDAVRAARQKAHEELEAAQKDLQLLLTPEQQAVLLTQGVLD